MTSRVSNMKASVSSIFCGSVRQRPPVRRLRGRGRVPTCNCAASAARNEALGLGVVDAVHQPHVLAHHVAVKPGGRKVCSATSQRGGKITKSQLAVPGTSLGEVSTVKIDGSGWSKLTVPIVLKRARSYL